MMGPMMGHKGGRNSYNRLSKLSTESLTKLCQENRLEEGGRMEMLQELMQHRQATEESLEKVTSKPHRSKSEIVRDRKVSRTKFESQAASVASGQARPFILNPGTRELLFPCIRCEMYKPRADFYRLNLDDAIHKCTICLNLPEEAAKEEEKTEEEQTLNMLRMIRDNKHRRSLKMGGLAPQKNAPLAVPMPVPE